MAPLINAMTTTDDNTSITVSPSQEEQKSQPLRNVNDNSNPQQASSGVGGVNAAATEQDGNNPDTSTSSIIPDKLQVSESVPGRPNNMMKNPPTKKDSRKLFVGGLPSDVIESEFREFFEQFGEVVDSVVMFDRETQRSRGFGFVTFRDSEVADMLLNTRQDEESAGGAALQTANGQRVGRLVMRGKTCEVKAAEPKEASRSARRGYQNQGFGGGFPNRRFGDKAYVGHGNDRQATAASMGAYHDPNYMLGHQHYSMMHPSYYPAYHHQHHHPGVYPGGGYHQAPMYGSMGSGAAVPGQNDRYDQVVPQPAVPPMIHGASQLEGALSPYGDSTYQEADAGHYYAYGHPHDMVHPSYPAYAGAPGTNPKLGQQHYAGSAYAAPGTSASVMHPAAPGIPPKDD